MLLLCDNILSRNFFSVVLCQACVSHSTARVADLSIFRRDRFAKAPFYVMLPSNMRRTRALMIDGKEYDRTTSRRMHQNNRNWQMRRSSSERRGLYTSWNAAKAESIAMASRVDRSDFILTFISLTLTCHWIYVYACGFSEISDSDSEIKRVLEDACDIAFDNEITETEPDVWWLDQWKIGWRHVKVIKKLCKKKISECKIIRVNVLGPWHA